jgi:predicted AlkP superfamily pyrophosphatase or phosphodiesterase
VTPRHCLVSLSLIVLAAAALAAESPPRKKVLVIGIDGCRPDALKAARTPNLDRLIRDGVLVENTEIIGDRPTGSDTISGPGWSSILTGVWADKHGVKDNEFRGANYREYPHFFRRLKDARSDAVTVSVVSWPPIHERIVSAADVSLALLGETKDYAKADARVAAEAKRLLVEKNPDALFVYFGNVDETGHKTGFHPAVPEYRQAIEDVDRHIGEVLESIRSRATYGDEDWLVLVCTDHGGRGTGHGDGHAFPEIRMVFLIISGPSAKREPVRENTYLVDVAATALSHLGVALQPEWKLDGRPVGLKGHRD